MTTDKPTTTASAHYGRYVDERCPNCGKFVDREEAFFDRKNRENDGSEVLRFCDIECADEWHDQSTRTF